MISIKYRKVREGRKIIDCILGHNGHRIELSTGIKLSEGVYFNPAGTFTGGTNIERGRLSSELHQWETLMRNRYNDIVSMHGYGFSHNLFSSNMRAVVAMKKGFDVVDGRATLSAFLTQFKDRLDSGKMTKKSNGRKFSEGTRTIYFRTITITEEFIIKYADFDFAKYNHTTEAVIGRAEVLNAYDDMCENFKIFLSKDHGYGQHATSNYINILRTIIVDRLESHGIIVTDRHLSKLKFKAPADAIVVAFSPEQYEWFMNNESLVRDDCKGIKTHSVMVDYMYGGLLTAARISDLMAFDMSNLIKTDRGYVLSYIPVKTKDTSGKKVEVPVAPLLLRIFLKNAELYNGKLLPPNMYRERASDYTRAILKKYSIFHNLVQFKDPFGVIKSAPLYEAFVFHGTRASLITYLIRKGEPEYVVKSFSGHSLDSKSFKVYTDISMADKIGAMNRLVFN